MPGGRPLTLDDLVTDPREPNAQITKADAIVEALRIGVPRETAARAAGVSSATFFRWLATGAEIAGLEEAAAEQGIEAPDLTPEQLRLREFREDVEKADAQAVVFAVDMVNKAMPNTWQAAMTFLERRFPGEWGRRVEVKVDPSDRQPAAASAETMAAAETAFAEAALPKDLKPDDFLPEVGEAEVANP